MSKKCLKKGEHPNIKQPNAKEASKYPFKQQSVPNTGTKYAENGANRGKLRRNFALGARHAPNALTYFLRYFTHGK